MSNVSSISKTTGRRAVIPFYLYASLSFLAACILLAAHIPETQGHYFQPVVLAIVHTLALGWGTMMILGAGHQLIPVIAESSLFSEPLAIVTFILAGGGIPLLVSGFFTFTFDMIAISGAICINLAVICYLVNLSLTVSRSTRPNVHSVFMFSGALWLFITVFSGLLLLLNFNRNILPLNSVDYLGWHAHMGIAGWFLLTIIGASSRLVPMFMLSEYINPRLLWIIFFLVNSALIFLSVNEILQLNISLIIPVVMIALAITGFIIFIFKTFKERIRKRVDLQMKISFVSILIMIIPALIMGCILTINKDIVPLAKVYGFIIFFGWVTTIIIAMTFKTLPFIIWNQVYGGKAFIPGQPSDLFSQKTFFLMVASYFAGFLTCLAGIIGGWINILTSGAIMMVFSSLVYNYQTFQLVFAKRS